MCRPTHFKTHVYVRMYNTLQESLSRGEVRQDCCCSKNVRYQIRGATCVADLEKQEITGNLENQKQEVKNKLKIMKEENKALCQISLVHFLKNKG